MGFLKFKGSRLFDGIQSHSDLVLVTNEEGRVIDLIGDKDAGDDVLVKEGIISPGFINCHCHLELSHMRSKIPEGTGLVDFVLNVVTNRHFPEAEILEAIDEAESEMLNNGIVAVGDICNNTLTISQKTKGRIYYHNFIEASGFLPSIANERFERALGFFREYARYYSIPVESNSIVPHAPYSVADELWQHIINFPGNHLMTIHNQEAVAENEWFIKKEGDLSVLYEKMNLDTSFFAAPGITSIQSYLGKFLANQSLILVHNVHTSEEDIHYSKTVPIANNLFWCLCPKANWFISRQLPPVDSFIKNNCTVVLGTDSLASNDELNILSEIRLLRINYPSINLDSMLSWATLNGAKALELDNQLGSFQKGKQPGVLLISNDLSAVTRLI